jgi:hypothetical protein
LGQYHWHHQQLDAYLSTYLIENIWVPSGDTVLGPEQPPASHSMIALVKTPIEQAYRDIGVTMA